MKGPSPAAKSNCYEYILLEYKESLSWNVITIFFTVYFASGFKDITLVFLIRDTGTNQNHDAVTEMFAFMHESCTWKMFFLSCVRIYTVILRINKCDGSEYIFYICLSVNQLLRALLLTRKQFK